MNKKLFLQMLTVAVITVGAALAWASGDAGGADGGLDLPWYFTLIWPALSTMLLAVIRLISGQAKDKVPPALWPVANAVISAVAAAVAATGNPAMLVQNILTAVLAALGLPKGLDLIKGKSNAVTPEDKALVEEAKALGVVAPK